MKNYTGAFYALTALILCTQFTLDQDNASVSGKSIKPAINFSGSITDNTGKKFKVQNITISGLYKQIPVFQKPKDMKDESYNPAINIIRLDLSEIGRITVSRPNDSYTFDNRKYLEIEVFSRDTAQTKNSYLIENSKKIICEEINPAGPIERELQFSAIQEIIIDTYTQQKQDEQDPKKQLCCTPCKDQSTQKHPKNSELKIPKKSTPNTPFKKQKEQKTPSKKSVKKQKEQEILSKKNGKLQDEHKKITLRNAQKHLNILQEKKRA